MFLILGAMTLGGDGCFFAQYPCPKHGNNHMGLIRDKWAEQHQNAAHSEQKCLSRAINQWVYCGSDQSSPVTSIYRPTGMAIRSCFHFFFNLKIITDQIVFRLLSS